MLLMQARRYQGLTNGNRDIRRALDILCCASWHFSMLVVPMTMQPKLTTGQKIAYRHVLQYHHGVCGLQTSTTAANGMVGQQTEKQYEA